MEDEYDLEQEIERQLALEEGEQTAKDEANPAVTKVGTAKDEQNPKTAATKVN